MTTKEAVALLERYSNYDGMGIPNLAGCKEAMRVAVDALKEACPELKESEDERIRKAIVGLIEELQRSDKYFAGVELTDMLAYLEKQKEPHYTKRNALFDKCVENCDPAVMKKVSDEIDEMLEKGQKPEWKPQPESLEALMYAIEGKWDMISPTSYLSRRLEDLYEGLVNTFNVDESLIAELPKVASRAYTAEDIEELRELKRKIEASMEQKPAEWSEEDKSFYDSIVCEVIKEGMHPTPEQAKWFKSLPERFSLQPNKQEWSEEDEKMLVGIVERGNSEIPKGECGLTPNQVAWLETRLKSLRPQPKQEWSEEDEDFINMLILHFNYLIDKGGDSVETYKSYIEKLKSLRPSWKPSKEQMKALEDAFRKDGSDEYRKTINSLYQQLKKL